MNTLKNIVGKIDWLYSPEDKSPKNHSKSALLISSGGTVIKEIDMATSSESENNSRCNSSHHLLSPIDLNSKLMLGRLNRSLSESVLQLNQDTSPRIDIPTPKYNKSNDTSLGIKTTGTQTSINNSKLNFDDYMIYIFNKKNMAQLGYLTVIAGVIYTLHRLSKKPIK